MKIDDNLLTQALINHNNHFVEELPDATELHDFSRRFEKKMSRLISANRKFGGHIWLERVTRYVTKIAVIVAGIVMVNFVSVQAFDLDIWQVFVTKTSEFISINFQKNNSEEQKPDKIGDINTTVRMKITNIPVGYTQQEFYSADNMTVQHLTSDNGTITYTESLITETANVNIRNGNQETDMAGDRLVSYISGDDSITAFFCDEEFYHILEIQGRDANKNFANEIIEGLEEQ